VVARSRFDGGVAVDNRFLMRLSCWIFAACCFVFLNPVILKAGLPGYSIGHRLQFQREIKGWIPKSPVRISMPAWFSARICLAQILGWITPPAV
jgi:hypothetical protein